MVEMSLERAAYLILKRCLEDERGHGLNANGLRFDDQLLRDIGLPIGLGRLALKSVYNARLIEGDPVYEVDSSDQPSHFARVKATPLGEGQFVQVSERPEGEPRLVL